MRDQSSSHFPGTAGGYAYIDSGYPRRPGDSAVLRLKQPLVTQPDSPLCLVFFVNLYGSGLGSLSLVAERADNSSIRTTLWELIRPASSPREVWNKAEVTISFQESVHLFFEATVGEVGRGDIGLDSVSLQPGPCVIRPHEAARYKAVSCSFNQDLCGYLSQNIPADATTWAQAPPLWMRVKGGGQFPRGHGASTDNEEEDWFAMFDVKNYQHRPRDRGFLIGPQIPISSEPLCIRYPCY